MADIWINILGDASKLKGALDKAGKNVTSFSDKIGKVGKVATVAGVAITAAFTKAFLNFTAYETKLIDMAKVTSEPFDQIEAKLGTINPILGTSTELMEGYYQVISAGVKDPVRALETLTVAAEAGKAAHVAQSEVVKGITKMMAGYEGAIKDASEAADLLFAIEKEGQTTVAELIPVIGGLAKISSDLNIEQTAMAASMAVISKTAGTTAEAATQYQAVLTGLMKPTEDMTAAMEDQGYASAELAIEDKGLVEVLKDLQEYSDRTGISMAKLFGRKEAMMGFSALGAEGFKVLDDTIISVGESAGGAERAFLEWSDSGAAAIDGIKNTFLNFSIMIGEKVAPMIKDLLGKVTDVITRVMEWADENEELTEKLFTWGLALGAALAVLGPIAVILPSLITGVTLLSGAFLPFVIGSAIVLGVKKLSDYMGKIKIDAFEAATGFRDWDLNRLNMEILEMEEVISDLSTELVGAEKEFKIFGITIKKQDVNVDRLKQVIKDYNIQLGLLKEQKEELIKVEEEGIDVAEERARIDEEAKKLIEELVKKEKELKEEIVDKTKAAELANAQMKIENDIFALTHTAYEIAIRDLDLLKQSYLDKGVAQEIVDKWHALEIKRLEELNKKQVKVNKTQEEHIDIMEQVAKVTKAVTDKIYELTHTPYEVKIKGINEEYDNYIEIVKEAKLSMEAEKIAIDNINVARTLEIQKLEELRKKEEEDLTQKNKLIDAYETITDKIYELTHTPMETMIKRLEEERQAYIDLGVEIELVDELFDLQIAKLSDVGDAFTALDNIVKPIITSITGYLETQLTNAILGLLGQVEDFEWSWANFWEGLKNVLINAVVAMIAKLAVLAALSWLFPWLIPFMSWEKGGGVGYDLGGKVEGFQAGGVADTIPARLTIGEYVIAKPMTDFIRATMAIPANLISAIAGGFPTPIPAFASGGLVGGPSSVSSFAETKIYVDIHDNRIANDVDIRKLSAKVSDEILRKLNGRKRH